MHKIIKGLTEPELIKNKLKFKLKSYIYFNYAVSGAYWTGNIGDRAIAHSFKKEGANRGDKIGLFPSNVGKTNSDMHILGGGGILRDCREAASGNDPKTLRTHLNWLSKADDSAIIGVGVPGFKTREGQELIRSILPNIDLITVRDRWSYDNLRDYYEGNIHVTACPAFMLPDPGLPSQGYTGVNFRPWPNYPSDIMSYHFGFDNIDVDWAKKEYVDNIKKICSKVINPVFIPFGKEDEHFANDHLNIDVLPYEFSVEKTLNRVSRADKMVTMRYHSLIFSAISNTPILAIAYQPKVSQLASRLGIQSYNPHEENIPIKFENAKIHKN